MNSKAFLFLAIVVTMTCSFSEAGNYWQTRGRPGGSNFRSNFRKRLVPILRPIRPEVLEKIMDEWDNGNTDFDIY